MKFEKAIITVAIIKGGNRPFILEDAWRVAIEFGRSSYVYPWTFTKKADAAARARLLRKMITDIDAKAKNQILKTIAPSLKRFEPNDH